MFGPWTSIPGTAGASHVEQLQLRLKLNSRKWVAQTCLGLGLSPICPGLSRLSDIKNRNEPTKEACPSRCSFSDRMTDSSEVIEHSCKVTVGVVLSLCARSRDLVALPVWDDVPQMFRGIGHHFLHDLFRGLDFAHQTDTAAGC